MQGALPNKIFNPLVQGTGVLVFSKLPIIVDDTLSTTSIQCNIREYAVPEIKAEMQYDRFLGATTVVPTSAVTDFSSVSLQVTFIADEDLDSYLLLYDWLDVYKRTTYRTDKNTPDMKHWDAKQAFCPYADICLMNNNNKVKTIFRFKRVFIETLGQLNQVFNSDEPVTFDAAFKFDEFFIYNKPDNINEIIGEYI